LDQEIQENKLLLLGRLAATLSHEIRNPLSALKLNLNYLQMLTEDKNSEMAESVNSSLEVVDRIQTLIESILEFSRRSTLDIEISSLNHLVNKAVNLLSGTAEKHSIKLIKKLDPKLPEIPLNNNKIIQVIINLVTNAIESSEKGEQIVIKTYFEYTENFKFVILEVEDFGTGISEEDQKLIFKDFFTKKKTGTGLGLSVCKTILDEFNAELYFKSTVGEGTKFFVKFPISISRDENEC
jgi:signal transduction histidine kinase